MVILHKADGHAITTLEETRVTYLHRNFQPHLTNLPFEEALAKMIYKTDTAYSKKAALREVRLVDSHQSNEPAPAATRTGQWPIPHQLYMNGSLRGRPSSALQPSELPSRCACFLYRRSPRQHLLG